MRNLKLFMFFVIFIFLVIFLNVDAAFGDYLYNFSLHSSLNNPRAITINESYIWIFNNDVGEKDIYKFYLNSSYITRDLDPITVESYSNLYGLIIHFDGNNDDFYLLDSSLAKIIKYETDLPWVFSSSPSLTQFTINFTYGIAYNGSHFFLSDSFKDVIYVYSVDWQYVSNYSLYNLDSRGLSYYENYFYVVDNTLDSVFKYDSNFAYISNFSLYSGNGDPFGIAINSSSILITDPFDDIVYVYALSLEGDQVDSPSGSGGGLVGDLFDFLTDSGSVCQITEPMVYGTYKRIIQFDSLFLDNLWLSIKSTFYYFICNLHASVINPNDIQNLPNLDIFK